MDKCDFSLKALSMLGHIVLEGSKRPDPEGLRALREYPVPGNSKAL